MHDDLQGDGSLLIERQSAREGRSKRTKCCILVVFFFFLEETRRELLLEEYGWLFFLGAVHHRPKIISWPSTLKVKTFQSSPAESILGAR